MRNILPVINILKPKPSPYTLLRIGGDEDGAYLVPNDLCGITHCFSPGVSNRKSFEDELSTFYGTKCHLCDYSVNLEDIQTPLIPFMQTFDKLWLNPFTDNNSISLADFVNKYTTPDDHNLILQMDIEGGEYDNLLAADPAVLRQFRIVIIEFHRLEELLKLRHQLNYISATIKKLSTMFISVHAHANNCCGDVIDTRTGLNVPSVLEITFLRKDRFFSIDGKHLRPIIHFPQIPHPLDISRNSIDKPKMWLSNKWLEVNPKSIEGSKLTTYEKIYLFSKRKMLSLISR